MLAPAPAAAAAAAAAARCRVRLSTSPPGPGEGNCESEVWSYIIAVPDEHYSLRFTNMADEAQVRSLPATHRRPGLCEAAMTSDRLRRAGRTSWWKLPSTVRRLPAAPPASSGARCGMRLTSCLEPGVMMSRNFALPRHRAKVRVTASRIP
jgi:hypothetical protein